MHGKFLTSHSACGIVGAFPNIVADVNAASDAAPGVYALRHGLDKAARVALIVACLMVIPVMALSYTPPPYICEMEPLTFAPPAPPMCAGPPPPPVCGPCPPMRMYPRKLEGPPPCPVTVCLPPPKPTKAAYTVSPPCAVPPPPACKGPSCP